MTYPKRPLPQPLRGSDPASFAEDTVIVRLPEIARKTVAENDFPAEIRANFQSLIDDIPHSHLRLLNDSNAPDAQLWAGYLQPYLGQNWLEVPWFVAETYFYRRIIEATGYFEAGSGQNLDPFAYQKELGYQTALPAIRALSARINQWLAQPKNGVETLSTLLTIALWGNQADLSLWPAEKNNHPNHSRAEDAKAYILVDDALPAARHLIAQPSATVCFIIDNAGFELVCDLALTDFLLQTEIASQVIFELKCHPTFVSDAMISDVRATIESLANDPHADTSQMGHRLQSALQSGRLQLLDHFFWTSPLPWWEMPPAVSARLGQAHLLISKGDANYRRLLGDLHWPFTTPFNDIVGYLPAPLVALRTLKSNVIAGLKAEQVTALFNEDKDWLTNGKRGVIQFKL